ncbi:hydroxysqualene dehydroxylase [Pusillimonas noertemannii]|uniref:Flavin-dependent amine oxidoreductase n=1 Tax=Pusillimonas noertemannii TaxID=305977 RepID=A0A2U1CI03_9BURK|nr:FAD-dependent oxidoreductase [Pusillimonas noertemannii]NYT69530.1 FAD-dependent oxidoreductase [Pusillimonas noertemannii]PVY60564.1 flavin-dependent amine oxidoreductase [Pusillimonas noertemannii]TFL09912.1 FAD-dependent oxidoreductase [Pusillimonas noertemannii]
MNIAVIGAGWAGLSAALELHRMGHGVTVFEAGHRLGGRARGLHSPRLNATLDNGQHIMLGAYTETLALMRRLGLDPDELLYSMPLALQSADGHFELRVPNLPDALALPAALLRAKGINWPERLRLAMLMSGLARRGWKVDPGSVMTPGQSRHRHGNTGGSPATVQWQAPDGARPGGLTVAQWLTRGQQSARLIRSFWEPLCLASMNTPIDRACAQLFANVLRDSLGAGPRACQVLISRVDLSSLWPERLPGDIRVERGHVVRRLDYGLEPIAAPPAVETPDTRTSDAPDARAASSPELHRPGAVGHHGVLVDGQPFDAVVVATNAQPARRLLSRLPATEDSQKYLAMLDAFEPMPIATLTLELSARWDMPDPMLMLADSPADGRFGQWLFHCNVFLSEPPPTSRLNIVISNAAGLRDHSEEQVAQGVLAQIAEQTAGMPSMPSVCRYELITEKRATFAAVPGLNRPSNATPWPRVYVAGDWTDTGYPAVLEGAVRSGLEAARALGGVNNNSRQDFN